jgi:hypothetical protein
LNNLSWKGTVGKMKVCRNDGIRKTVFARGRPIPAPQELWKKCLINGISQTIIVSLTSDSVKNEDDADRITNHHGEGHDGTGF